MFYLNLIIALLVSYQFEPPERANTETNCKNITFKKEIRLNDESDPIRVPIIYIDNKSNFIITDVTAHNVKVFDEHGKMIQLFGRYGRGPGDFELPMSSIRIKDSIVTVTLGGKLTVWDLNTKKIHNIANIPILGVSKIMQLNDSLLVMSGMNIQGSNRLESKRLHLVDLNMNEIVLSFFDEPEDYFPYRGVTTSIADIMNLDVLGDRILVNFGASTKIYVFKYNQYGVGLEFVQDLGITDNFDSILDNKITDLLDVRTTASKYSTVHNLFFLNDGNIVGQVRKYNPLDVSGNSTGAQYSIFYHETDTGQSCWLSLSGSLAATDGESIYVVNESDYTVLYKYKIGE